MRDMFSDDANYSGRVLRQISWPELHRLAGEVKRVRGTEPRKDDMPIVGNFTD